MAASGSAIALLKCAALAACTQRSALSIRVARITLCTLLLARYFMHVAYTRVIHNCQRDPYLSIAIIDSVTIVVVIELTKQGRYTFPETITTKQ